MCRTNQATLINGVKALSKAETVLMSTKALLAWRHEKSIDGVKQLVPGQLWQQHVKKKQELKATRQQESQMIAIAQKIEYYLLQTVPAGRSRGQSA